MEKKDDMKEKKLNSLKKIAEINSVEGFYPEVFAEEVMMTDTGETKLHLPVMYKRAWCRMKNPDYKTSFDILEKAEDYIIVRARIHKSYQDDKENYIGEGIGVAYIDVLTPSDKKRYSDMLLMARGSAEASALANAGFGYQFAYGPEDALLKIKGKETEQIAKDNNGFIPQNTPCEEKATASDTYKEDENVKSVKVNEDELLKKAASAIKKQKKIIINVDALKNEFVLLEDDADIAAARKKLEKLRSDWNKAQEDVNKARDAKIPLEDVKEPEFLLPEESAGGIDGELPDESENNDMTDMDEGDSMDKMSLEEALQVKSTFKQYAGTTMRELLETMAPILVWLANKQGIPEKERLAARTVCLNNANLAAKLNR